MLSLRQIPLFSALSEEEIHQLSLILRPREFKHGAIVCEEGQPGDQFYVVLEGQVEVVKTLGQGQQRRLGTRGPGEFIGEMSLFDHQGMRSASVYAMTPVMAVEMNHADLDQLLQKYPKLAYELVRELSIRLRFTDEAVIHDLQEKNRQLERAYQELQAAQAQVIEKEKLEHEIQMARRIQESILPTTLPQMPGYDFGGKVSPARAVGGDFFDIIPLDHDKMGILIGDVSGKGMPAAIFMALARSLTRVEVFSGQRPAQALQRVNQHLLHMNEAGMFVTVLYGILECAAGQFCYARAGHEIPWVFDGAGQVHCPKMERGQPLGLLPNPILDEQSIQIGPGDTLLLTTDGASDIENEQGVRLGYVGLEEAVRKNLAPEASTTITRLYQEMVEYQGEAAQSDDITLVTIHRR